MALLANWFEWPATNRPNGRWAVDGKATHSDERRYLPPDLEMTSTMYAPEHTAHTASGTSTAELDDLCVPLPVDAWLPPPVGGPLHVERNPIGRPLRDNAVLADVRSRFRPTVAKVGFNKDLNPELGRAVKEAFLVAWRTHLGVADGTPLNIRAHPRGKYTASQLAYYGKVEELLELLSTATATPLADMGRQAMGELHSQGYIGQVGRRVAADRRGDDHQPALLDRDTYKDARSWVLRGLVRGGFNIAVPEGRRVNNGGTAGQLIDDCVRCVAGDVDRFEVASRCVALLSGESAPPPWVHISATAG